MREWIAAMEKAAFEHGPGATPEDWGEAERLLGQPGPDELRELYARLDGARLAGGVELFPLRGELGRAVLAPGASPVAGLPSSDIWRFGRRDDEDLLAIRKRNIDEIEQPEVFAAPRWFDDLDDDAWIYLARDGFTSEVRLYRTLEELLGEMVVEREDGEGRGFSRTRRRLEGALRELAESASRNVEMFIAAVSKGVRGKSASGRGKTPGKGKRSATPKRRAAPRGSRD
jgi:hypothetical protein